MNTSEAFKIFTPDQIESLSPENLKMLKKEFILHYQLTRQPTVSFNGHALDKNSLLEIFDHLDTSLDKHLKHYESHIIDTFLKNGDLNYLISDRHGRHIVKAMISQPNLRDNLLHKVSEIIGETFITPSEDREELLQKVLMLTDQLPFDYEERAYAASARYLRNEIESIKTRYDNPFLDNHSLNLEPELHAMVDIRFLKLFQLLPEKFHFLAYEYCLWCQDFILRLTQYREENYAKYPINALLIIRNATLIASEYYETDANLKLASHITSLLKNPSSLAKNAKTRFNPSSKKDSEVFKFSGRYLIYILLGCILALLYLALYLAS